MIATTSGLNKVSGSTVVSDIMIIFMFYHRTNKMNSDSDSDTVSIASSINYTTLIQPPRLPV